MTQLSRKDAPAGDLDCERLRSSPAGCWEDSVHTALTAPCFSLPSQFQSLLFQPLLQSWESFNILPSKSQFCFLLPELGQFVAIKNSEMYSDFSRTLGREACMPGVNYSDKKNS
jgi:hypothetical protein